MFNLLVPSFKSLSKWLQEVERYAEEGVVVVLAGNKLDLGQANFKVNPQEIEEFKSKCVSFFSSFLSLL